MGAFLDLVSDEQVARVTLAIECAIAESFAADGARMTGAEVRRRFGICERLVRQLRGDLGWGLERVLHHLPRYLRCELDGEPWTPDARAVWVPEDEISAGRPAGGDTWKR
jgi:hypothetical protein